MSQVNRVFVLDKNSRPLMPTHPARARILLKKGRAAVYRLEPFTIILKDRTIEESECQPISLKVDPGSKTTGLALVARFKRGNVLIWAANLTHRGLLIKERLDKRRNVRRSRRSRKTRYRKPRYNNRRRKAGWLPPSLMSRVLNIYQWGIKLCKFASITEIEVETVRFDTQKLVNPEISGVEYQQGTLAGYEVREYLLEKWGRKCAYCDKSGIPLQIEHIRPKRRHGSDRVSNLTLACHECNQKKGIQDIRVFLANDPKRLDSILKQTQRSLRDPAALNAIRYAIGNVLKSLGLSTTFWSGGRTKFNRIRQGYAKDHWIDAACVGITGQEVVIPENLIPLYIKAVGRGNRQKCLMDKYGFPRTRKDKETGKPVLIKPRGTKRVQGFQTGDIVKGRMTHGKNKGTYIGRVTIRADGRFVLKSTQNGFKVEPNWKNGVLLQHADGYEYSHKHTNHRNNTSKHHTIPRESRK